MLKKEVCYVMKNGKKIIKSVIMVVLALVYYYLLYKMFLQSVFNSDFANLVLEGNDILHGNFLLSGWNLTGISFIASDLLLHTIGVAFKGISPEATVIASSIAIWGLTIVCFLLLHDKKGKITNLYGYLFFVAVAAFPCDFLINVGRCHTACIVESLFALYLLNSAHNDGNKRIYYTKLVLSLILFSLAALSDADSIITIIVSVLLVSLWNAVYDYVRDGIINKRHLTNLFVGAFSIVLSFIFDKLFYLIGGANKNSFFERITFIPLENYIDKIKIYFSAVFQLFDADFPGKKLFALDTVFYFIRVLIIILAFIFIVYNIVQLIRRKNDDYITAVLSVGVMLVSVVFIITNIAVDTAGARYIGTFPALFVVIIVRTITNLNINWDKLYGLIVGKVIYILSCLALIVNIMIPLPFGEISHLEQQEQLISVLEENGLHCGYASFWNASSTTVISHNKVRIRAVLGSDGKIEMFNWFCKNEWYTEPAYFAVVSDDDMYGMTYENVKSVLGEPKEILETESSQIMVYDFDISTYLA